MTRKAILAGVVFVLAMSVRADWLYYMVNGAYSLYDNASMVSFSYAQVTANNKDGTTQLLNIWEDGKDTGYASLYAPDGGGSSTAEAAFVGNFDSANVSSFYVELLNDRDEAVGWQTYSIASALDYIWKGSDSATGGTPLVVSEVVPEPTSALLLLLGCSLLALRRSQSAVSK